MNFFKSQFHGEISDIINEIKKQAENEFVQQYVDIPPVPLVRLQVLFLFLLDSNVTVENIKKYAVPTLLIQIGLDCHEKVSLTTYRDLNQIRSRQLAVLAGDFYSSKYYYLLSQIEDIELVRSLADSILKINEVKTEVYTSLSKLSADQLLALLNTIDSGLYLSFLSRYVQDGGRNLWRNIIINFIRVERLTDELLSFRWGQIVKIQLSKLLEDRTIQESCAWLQGQALELLDEIATQVNQLEQPRVQGELQNMVDAFRQQLKSQVFG
ncbi:heptaprenyl diphosphate synthase component 1 [Ammoniphilus resinae]|uniref:Heptaprenyl diphosphate synthase n=1 Tax=Ammoniphilus resinae TaxID=861532 RepID=A0ABS4GT83_9BACL|nr:heptaprenyl diphosphate synthase component 1 [Ammoniphilus resinae]MBP1933456.1 heptaprenyl diphosphate synthase [Ammoniphilus resinae]